jgi:ribosomal subunit interface protein
MAFVPRITIRDIPHSEALEAYITKKADKLYNYCNRIMQCSVVVDQAQKHKHQGKLYNARIDITVPGSELAVNHAIDEDVYVAVRKAFDALRSQLVSFTAKQRGDVKTHDQALLGKVVKLFPEEQFGFIEHNGEEYYFSSENVVKPTFDKLEIGTEVQFIESLGNEGKQANRITCGKHHY